MIYEMRVYRCVPGQLPRLLNRFDTITLKLWEKHGIKQAGFWTTLIGESNQTLYYLLEWESLAERERKWNAFGADPEWLAKRAETEKDGAIVADIRSGVGEHPRVHVIHDRRAALAHAIGKARPGDVVLIAGKGHETEQIVDRERRSFSDRAVVAELLGVTP